MKTQSLCLPPLSARPAKGAGASPAALAVKTVAGAQGLPQSDFFNVRLHPDAAEVTAPLQAKAVTRGQDIYFHPGQFQPGKPNGEALIAHELAHTLQTRGLATAGGGPATFVSQPGDAFEKNADALARGETTHALAAPAGAALRTPFPGETAEEERRRLAAIAVLQRAISRIRLMQITNQLWPEEELLPDGRIRSSLTGETMSHDARDVYVAHAAENIIALISRLESAAAPADWNTPFVRFPRRRGGGSISVGSDRASDPNSPAITDAQTFYVHWSEGAGHTVHDVDVESYYIFYGPPPVETAALDYSSQAPPPVHPFEGGHSPVAHIVVDDPERAPLTYHLVTGTLPVRGYLADVYHDSHGHYYTYHGRRIYLPDFH